MKKWREQPDKSGLWRVEWCSWWRAAMKKWREQPMEGGSWTDEEWLMYRWRVIYGRVYGCSQNSEEWLMKLCWVVNLWVKSGSGRVVDDGSWEGEGWLMKEWRMAHEGVKSGSWRGERWLMKSSRVAHEEMKGGLMKSWRLANEEVKGGSLWSEGWLMKWW